MNRRVGTVGLVVLLVLTAVGSGASALAARPGPAFESGSDPAPVPQTTPEGFDSTVFRITVYENGSARWTLQFLRLLENDTQVTTFEQYEAEFERTEPQFVREFRIRAVRLTRFGTNATGREMNATGFRHDAFIRPQPGGTQAVGIVELSFVWTNFAQTRGRRVVVSDVFDGGMYIDTNQRLVFSHGPDLVFASVDPDPDSMEVAGNLTASDTVTWVGEKRFLDARPRVEYVTVGAATGSNPADGTASASDPAAERGRDPSGLMIPLAVGLVVVLGLGGVAWYSGALSRDRDATESAGGATTASDATSRTGAADADGPGTGAETGSATGAGTAVSEEELLSDEDRVVKLLEENGGRMKQVDIVDETEWSKSKVSMLLSDMEEEGEISKLRVGRENIVSLSGHEPDAAGSPFDDE